MPVTIDDRDREIIAERAAAYDLKPGPRVGDWLIFADGQERRISVVYGPEYTRHGVQTTRDGRFHLGRYGVSCSGAYDEITPMDSIAPNGKTRPGRIWIFHHDYRCRDNGVEAEIPFRVYYSTLPAPTC